MSPELSAGPVDVSVIIPTYNRATLVAEAIESVLRQTSPPREIIVVDDGSTDETPRVLASFGDRLIVVRQENRGVGAARNRALATATGRYLAFLDSDDLWMEPKLTWQVAVMNSLPDLGFVFSDFVIIGEKGQATPHGLRTWFHHRLEWDAVFEEMKVAQVSCTLRESPVTVYTGRIYRALLSHAYVLPSCAIVRADCLTPDSRFPEDNPHCSDWEFFARLSRKHPAGFMDVETTINRGGHDWPRLTHMSAAAKAGHHLAMIDAVWKRDREFLSEHRNLVQTVEADLWLHLARCHVLDSNRPAARAALQRWNALRPARHRSTAAVLALCAWSPGSSAVLKGIRAVARKVARIARSADSTGKEHV